MALNTVQLMGRLAADPVLKTTAGGKVVAGFRLAVDRGAKDRDGNSLTDWLDCVAWEKSAEFIERYFAKGSLICVEGQLQSRNYQDKNGNKRTAVEVVVRKAHFCGGKTESRQPDVQPAAVYSAGNEADFVQVGDDEDLPF